MAAQLEELSAPAKARADRMRHADASITLNTYTRVPDEAAFKLANRFRDPFAVEAVNEGEELRSAVGLHGPPLNETGLVRPVLTGKANEPMEQPGPRRDSHEQVSPMVSRRGFEPLLPE